MQRWKLTIEYKGCIFNGWQSQKDLTGVQDYIQKAIYDFSKEKINSLLDGFRNISLEKFEEGNFPRKLFIVIQKKI